MRISKSYFCLTLILAIVAAVPTVRAQRDIQQIPPLVTYDGANPDLAHPFIDPFAFNPDFQFFAPADLSDYGGRPEGPVGWFFEYNRMYLAVSRPEAEVSSTEMDFSWGNRYDVGWMSDEKHGWWFSHIHLDGPNAYFIPTVERINRLNQDDLDNLLNPPTDPADNVFPVIDRNDPLLLGRFYRLHQSLNSGDLTGFDLNKTFRFDPLHYGTTVEPFFGVRYNKFRDYFRRDTYGRFEEAGGGPVVFPVPAPPLADVTIEELQTVQANWDNHMVGGQLGIRWFTQKSRWHLSGEVRAFALQNFQNFHSQTLVERTYYDGNTTDDGVIATFVTRQTAGGHAAEFVIGTEVRADAAFQFTRDIRFNTGIQFMEFGRGIARGNSLQRNDENLTMIGVVFGIEVNR